MQFLGHLCVSQANLAVKNSIKFTYTFLYGICTYEPMLVLSSFLDGNGSRKGEERDKCPGMWLGLQPKWNICRFFLITHRSTLTSWLAWTQIKNPFPPSTLLCLTVSYGCRLPFQLMLLVQGCQIQRHRILNPSLLSW